MHLTDQRIRGLPLTQSGQRHYVDDAVLGMSVCVGIRKKTFTVIVRKRHKRKRYTLGRYDPPLHARHRARSPRSYTTPWDTICRNAGAVAAGTG